MLSEKHLTGVWLLVDHYYLDGDGSISAGPMGERADGLLIYHDDGYMSASLARTEQLSSENGAAPTSYLGSTDDYLGYCGRWKLRDDTVIHQVLLGSHPRVANTEQVRKVELNDDGNLRLSRRLDGPHDYVVMDWRRANC